MTAVPAHSLPWMQPTTSALLSAADVAGANGHDRPAPHRPADLNAPLRVGPDADVHVVVVVDEPLDLPPWPREADAGPDEDLHRARLDEARHELLGERRGRPGLGRAGLSSCPSSRG